MSKHDLMSGATMAHFEPWVNADTAKRRLQAHLPCFSDGKLEITACKLGYTWYKTYQNPRSLGKTTLSLCYDLQVRVPSTKKSGEQRLYAKVYLENRSQLAFEQSGTSGFVRPAYGLPCCHLPEFDMIVWAFPNDPVLSQLPECSDPEKVPHYFPYDTLPSGLNGPEDLLKVEVDVVHYRPEVRCTTRYLLRWGSEDAPKTACLVGKTFKDEQGLILLERAKVLLEENKDQPESFLVARPLGYTASIKTLWQQGLEGLPLPDAIEAGNIQILMPRLAKGLACFHQSAFKSPLRISLQDHLAEIRKKITKLKRAFPQFEKRLQVILSRLEREVDGLRPLPETLIHADFSVQQVLVCGERLACFDFDEFTMGDPAQDVANFIVDVHFRGYALALVEKMIPLFLKAYEDKARLKIPGAGLQWYLRVLFVTKAYRYYLQRRPQLEAQIEAILTLAQKTIPLEEGE